MPDEDVRDFHDTAFGAPRIRHARDPRLRTGRAGRLGAHQSAGQRGVRDQRARRQRPAHRAAPQQLAAGAAGRGAELQRLPRPGAAVCRTAGSDLFDAVNAGATTTGQPFPEQRTRRSSPTSARPWRRRATRDQLPDRLRGAHAPARHRVRRRVDRPGRREPRTRPELRVPLCRSADTGADQRRLHDGLARGLPDHDPLREPHPSAVEQAASHACSRRRHRARRRHLHDAATRVPRRRPGSST